MHSKRVVAGGMEIEKQLDDLLDQQNQTSLSKGDTKVENPSMSPLTSLKSIVLSMDWEINDPILREFIQELNRLKSIFQQDGIVVKSLQLLEALGKYILQKKARTHPDSIRLLQSIYRDLEILLLSKGISDTVRRNILVDQVAQFMKLKEKLAASPKQMTGYLTGETEISETTSDHASSDAAHQGAVPEDKDRIPSIESVLNALEEIKKYIQSEFSALRAELKL